ncbi:MAG TPA: carboxypeptidase M32, partial [Anaerolineaceae bacterium]
MEEKLGRLKSILGEIQDLEYTSSILDWDKQTNMPKGGSEDRAFQLGTLSAILHEKSTSSELGHLLEDLQSPASSLDPESDEARLVKRAARDFRKRTRVPTDL